MAEHVRPVRCRRRWLPSGHGVAGYVLLSCAIILAAVPLFSSVSSSVSSLTSVSATGVQILEDASGTDLIVSDRDSPQAAVIGAHGEIGFADEGQGQKVDHKARKLEKLK
jgi:hypothetical protein